MCESPALLKRLLTSLEQAEEGEASVSSPAATQPSATDSVDKAPVVKAKATHVIMNSLITSKHFSSSEEKAAGVGRVGASCRLVAGGVRRLPRLACRVPALPGACPRGCRRCC